MKKLNPNDYIVIQAPMITDLKLSGNALVIFALIYGFSKDGNHRFKGSLDYISTWTNTTKQTVIAVLKKLQDDGFINKYENSINNVKFCEYDTNYEQLLADLNGSQKTLTGVVKKFDHINTIDNIVKDKEDKSSLKKSDENVDLFGQVVEQSTGNNQCDDEFVDEIYKMYPSKCPMRNISTCKCAKNKAQIKKLLKTYTKDEIRLVVQNELDEKLGKHYLSNFSTFLNNFPDPKELDVHTNNEFKQEINNGETLIIGGVEYK